MEVFTEINYQMNNILITSAGKRVSLINAFKKELSYFPDEKFCNRLQPQLSAACMIADGWKLSLNSHNYVNELIKICKDNKISLIIPTIDTELLLLAENEALLKANSINVVLSS
jgi:carbamoyl-phosphate synthase large subunit